MFVDKLALAITAQQHAEVIEPSDHALQFHAVHQEHRDRNFLFPNLIQEAVL